MVADPNGDAGGKIDRIQRTRSYKVAVVIKFEILCIQVVGDVKKVVAAERDTGWIELVAII